MEKYKSSVFFQSNVLPVGKTFYEPGFLFRITDPAALEKLSKLTRLTPPQEEILKKCGFHCAYAEKDDYPWGIPAGFHEKAKPVCLCTQTRCKHFGQCRPDFIPGENETTGITGTDAGVQEATTEKPDADITCPGHDEEAVPTQDTGFRLLAGVCVTGSGTPPLSAPPETLPCRNPMPPDRKLEGSEESIQNHIPDSAGEPDDISCYPPEEDECPPDNTEEDYQEEISASGDYTGDGLTPEQVSDNDPSGPEPVILCPEAVPGGVHAFEAFTPATQDAVVSLPASAKVLVNAPPGTGKTWTLIQRIRYLVEEEGIAPGQILALTFTRAAAAVIRERLGDAARDGAEIADIDAGTFHSFAFSLLNQCRETYPELCPPTAGMSYEKGISTATSLLRTCRKEQEPLLEDYRHVIIDEIQDLSGERALLVMELLESLPSACGLTLLGDSCQSIYDWQNDNDKSKIFSADLYEWLMSPAAGITLYISFSRDYRKCGDGLPDTTDFRRAILAGKRAEIDSQFSALTGRIRYPVPELETKEARDIIRSCSKGETLGILTRTNGMALAVSSWLSSWEIAHVRLRQAEEDCLANWIADILMDQGNDTIHRDDFSARFMGLYGKTENEGMAYACWNALAGEDSRARREIRDLLARIPGSRDPLLWRHAGTMHPLIEVGNVFRVKGREYDNVILIDELFRGMGDRAGNADEDRVKYVALTRARKRILRFPSRKGADYLAKDKLGDKDKSGDRVFKRGHTKSIALFEVGLKGDIVPESFAETSEAQEYITEFTLPGVEITFSKKEKEGRIPRYEVCVGNDDEKYAIGTTAKSFGESLKRTLQRIYNYPHIAYRFYPDSMSGIYVTGRNSHVSVWKPSLTGAAQFGDMALWRGISCHGLASTYRKSY